ncbi:MAG TPA: translation initiation factor IF-2 [Gemmataceae bacterium]|nr:translation initiation factor IF-2 [Gemmataceae bacterium]
MPVQELCLREKVRVYALARELNVESKDLLELCQKSGLDVKNQLSSLDPDQRDMIEALVKRGGLNASAPPAPKPAAHAPLPDVQKTIRNLDNRPVRREVEPARPTAAKPPVPAEPVSPTPAPPAETVKPPVIPAPAAKAPETVSPPSAPVKPPSAPPPAAKPPVVPETPGKVRELESRPARPTRRPRDIRPTPHLAAPLPPLKPPPAKPKKAEEPKAQQPIARLTPDQLAQSKPIKPEDVIKPVQPGEIPEFEEEDSEKGKRPKGVAGRDKRQQARNERARQRKGRGLEVEVQKEAGGRVSVLEPEERIRKPTRIKLKHKQPTMPRKGKVPIELPISVRSLSEASGIRSLDLLFKLRDHGMANATLNSTIAPDLAEILALESGCELEIKRPTDVEEQLLANLDRPDEPGEMVPRAPVVTIMGHVDRGKTSLLDKIRQSNVVATEAGGITQVIRAWRVEHGGRPITFLDTPGHEAFTKMRARGAQVTDIAVIVVAADDGVMPQTEEAINHAKAAGVSLVVAINKVDLPSANVNKTRQQLYSLEVLPDNMGGDTPFVETSAATGKGIDELLDQLSVVAELKELKANPHKPGQGTCLEAMLSEGEGVRATLLVRDGTLRRGDVILCGATYGRVRQMYDDQGQAIEEAGPSVPVRITGLDGVPNADDPFVVVTDLAGARAIAEKRQQRQQEASQFKRVPVTLEKLTEAKIAELKIILKADFRGSIEAIRKELEKLHHEEVRVRILEAAIGAITENDVWLALTSPQDTLIIGFNVVPDDRARTLAEEKGVQIREYDIIYNLTNDIRAALEGKLKPREEVVNLGRAVVRNTFKISRVGTIAGCYVTQGLIRRNAKVRLIREGVVIYPPADRTAGLDSLKRFKEDAAEVREGFECGLKISGYDDVKVGDVIEAFRVEQVQRTL